ncbi:hypothetical protein K523DRAFT_328520, partial [Schizophyllum commune Tattone D]
ATLREDYGKGSPREVLTHLAPREEYRDAAEQVSTVYGTHLEEERRLGQVKLPKVLAREHPPLSSMEDATRLLREATYTEIVAKTTKEEYRSDPPRRKPVTPEPIVEKQSKRKDERKASELRKQREESESRKLREESELRKRHEQEEEHRKQEAKHKKEEQWEREKREKEERREKEKQEKEKKKAHRSSKEREAKEAMIISHLGYSKKDPYPVMLGIPHSKKTCELSPVAKAASISPSDSYSLAKQKSGGPLSARQSETRHSCDPSPDNDLLGKLIKNVANGKGLMLRETRKKKDSKEHNTPPHRQLHMDASEGKGSVPHSESGSKKAGRPEKDSSK